MKTGHICSIVSFTLITMLLSLGSSAAFAASDSAAPMTPQLAAKGNRVKTQQSQKVTQAQRQAAADLLKAERQKLHKAQQGAAQPAGQTPAPAPVTQ